MKSLGTSGSTEMAKELVNHPPHYTAHPSGVECIEITEHMNFNLGNAVKYVWRADLKHDAIEDLSKAAFYIDREIARRRLEAAKEDDRAKRGTAETPVVPDVTPSLMDTAWLDHFHTPTGRCLKNRFGPTCTEAS